MLIMPYSHDQPDNARRMRRLKVGLSIMKAKYTPARVAKRLTAMLAKPDLAQQAARVAEQLKHEDGVKTACDALERLHADTLKTG
jgi:UDP:flavonoid glycosyltransferase YjiC (YdhE family)